MKLFSRKWSERDGFDQILFFISQGPKEISYLTVNVVVRFDR